MTDLILCASCERHFRPGDAQCPFCGAAASSRAPIARAPKGLSRARLYALHTAALATGVAMAVACGGDTTTGGDASTDGSGKDVTTSDAANDATGDGTTASDAAKDVVADQSSGDASADVVEDDGWGPPPPPYGCVFPGGCNSVTV